MKHINLNSGLQLWHKARPFIVGALLYSGVANAQSANPVINNIMTEETSNSQLEDLARQLFDGIGPRLVGTPQMKQANDWAVAKYKSWDIQAHNEKWGEWRGWERGVSHIDMISPRGKIVRGYPTGLEPRHGQKNGNGRTHYFARTGRFRCFSAMAAQCKR
jgi:carboxypeptidase Q